MNCASMCTCSMFAVAITEEAFPLDRCRLSQVTVVTYRRFIDWLKVIYIASV